jgi:hypothetical protein
MAIDGLWDWACLDGCFGETKIKPNNIDGMVERNSRFLLLEAIRPETKLPYRQDVIFRRLIQTGLFTVIIIWGEKNNAQKIELRTSRGIKHYENASNNTLWNIVAQWFDFANKNRSVPPKRRLS